MKQKDFMPEVRNCVKQLVSASIAIYYKMVNTMPATPKKCHYLFNTRQLSQVIKGVMQVWSYVVVYESILLILKQILWMELMLAFSSFLSNHQFCCLNTWNFKRGSGQILIWKRSGGSLVFSIKMTKKL